jgi:hypothetical protein
VDFSIREYSDPNGIPRFAPSRSSHRSSSAARQSAPSHRYKTARASAPRRGGLRSVPRRGASGLAARHTSRSRPNQMPRACSQSISLAQAGPVRGVARPPRDMFAPGAPCARAPRSGCAPGGKRAVARRRPPTSPLRRAPSAQILCRSVVVFILLSSPLARSLALSLQGPRPVSTCRALGIASERRARIQAAKPSRYPR